VDEITNSGGLFQGIPGTEGKTHSLRVTEINRYAMPRDDADMRSHFLQHRLESP
jgi:hypothetical protein